MQNAPRSFGFHGLFTSLFALAFVGAVGCSSTTSSGDGGLVASNGDGTCKRGGPCSCEGSAPCTLRCVGGGCDFKCQGSGRCDFSCPEGGCTVSNQNSGSATLDCGGKTDCSMSCQGSGSCDLKACVDKCSQTCQGSVACTMTGCNGTCTQTCAGGGKCEGGTGAKVDADGGVTSPGFDAATIPPTPGFDAGSNGGGGQSCTDLADLCGSCPTPQLIQSCSATASAGNETNCAAALKNYETQCQ